MKKLLAPILIITLSISLLFTSGCSYITKNEEREFNVLKSYPEENAPSQIIKTEKYWTMLFNSYESQDYSISVSENLDVENIIYNIENVNIWYFEANDYAIVWCEKSLENYTYKIYKFDSKEIETIFQISVDIGFQPQNIGIYNNFVYYCTIDYSLQKVNLIEYDINKKTTNVYYTTDFNENNQPYSINLENEFLSFFSSDQIKVFNIKNNTISFESPLSDTIKHIFAISYDDTNNTCALYYADEDSEDIGILSKDENTVVSIFTFSENHYAYQDKIKCKDGHIYWITQGNVSGYVTDHYKLVNYNYLDNTVTEIDKTFCLHYNDNNLYFLRFNKNGEYTHINLCSY